MKAALLHPNTEVDMYIKWPEGIVDLGIITREFLEKYCISLGKSVHENVETALLWLRLLSKYLVNKCNLERIKADSCIFFMKNNREKSEPVMSVHVDSVFMAGKTEALNNTKENIMEEFNI